MSNSVFNSLQITSESDGAGMRLVAAKAQELWLATTGVVKLPINGYYWMMVLPSGSKDSRTEEIEHLARLTTLTQFIESHNTAQGGRYLVAAHLRVLDNGMGDDLVGVVYHSPEVAEE